MKSLLISTYGTQPLVLSSQQLHIELGPNEVYVRIEAAAFNPLDSKIAAGYMKEWFPIRFPYTLGTDFAGTVEKVGNRVIDILPGDSVFGRSDPVDGGAIATHVVVSANLVAQRPLNLTAAAAACLPTPVGIALQGLNALGRHWDEPFLILGDGAVAKAAKAIAGAVAILASSEAEVLAAPSVRYVFDAVGGELQQHALERLPHGSVMVSIVNPVEPDTAARRGVEAQFAVLQTDKKLLNEIASLASLGLFRAEPDHVVEFDDASTAFERYSGRELSGKIIVKGALV
jgi:NADPH:quinone reductase-like Zn-dependent oxidoreductase